MNDLPEIKVRCWFATDGCVQVLAEVFAPGVVLGDWVQEYEYVSRPSLIERLRGITWKGKIEIAEVRVRALAARRVAQWIRSYLESGVTVNEIRRRQNQDPVPGGGVPPGPPA